MFESGQVIETFTTREGNDILFKFPSLSDVEKLRNYINELSLEDTFITLSGEQYSVEEEKKVVEEWVDEMSKGDTAVIVGWLEDKVISITQVTRGTRREKHVGTIGISVRKGYREEGIGTRSMELLESFAHQMNLKLLVLHVYQPNDHALYVYEKVGYKEVGRIPKGSLFHGEYIDNIIMVKHL